MPREGLIPFLIVRCIGEDAVHDAGKITVVSIILAAAITKEETSSQSGDTLKKSDA
jgi:hypothetical protein